MARICLRMENELHDLIKDYAEFMGMSESKILRELLREGLVNKTQAKLYSAWQDKIKNRLPETCDKCGTKDNLQNYYIDGNSDNLVPENIAILCNGDRIKLQNSIMRNNLKEKFIRWFFFDN